MKNLNYKKEAQNSNIELKSVELTQFELTKAIYTSEIFAKVDLTASAKLFLWALCTHFNPNKETMFPSQMYVAKRLGISEKSAERAVKELKDKGLLTYVTKKVNHYSFSDNFFELVKMSGAVRQNVGSHTRQNVGQTNNHEQKNNTKSFKNNFYNRQNPLESGGKAVPSIEETKKYIENFEREKEKSINPFEYSEKEALKWLKMAPKWMIGRSKLAKTLVEKYAFEEFLYILEA